MRSVLALALPLLLAACDAGDAVTADLPRLGADTEAAYQEDAAILALRYQLEVERDSQTVALSGERIQSLYEALVRVRASEHGDVVEGIHTFPRTSVHEVFVGADTSVTWSNAWRQGDVVTGYTLIDDLVEEFGLTLGEFYDLQWAASAVLHSDAPLNTVALGRRFASVPGVEFADSNGYVGDGDDITAVRDGGGWQLEFSRGSGDCPAGCIYRTFWTFRVEGGQVTYLGTRER